MASLSVSVKEVLDSARFSGYQAWICSLCFTLTFFDGFDLSLVGVSLPKIAEFLHSKPTAMGMVMSAGNVGALIGALVLGLLADRWGRKNMLVVSAFMFGVFYLVNFLYSIFGAVGRIPLPCRPWFRRSRSECARIRFGICAK
jgi:MFS transporter, AAHS family, 4-hydroxybenzoate transporter